MDNVRTLHDNLGEYQVVDVREAWEWQAGRIDGSVHVPLNLLLGGGEQGLVDQSRPVVLVCKSGNRSELATMMLRARGYEAENLEGGLEDWAAAGLPLTTPEGEPGRVA
jgi:rhodanese-related sulfurtransferase